MRPRAIRPALSSRTLSTKAERYDRKLDEKCRLRLLYAINDCQYRVSVWAPVGMGIAEGRRGTLKVIAAGMRRLAAFEGTHGRIISARRDNRQREPTSRLKFGWSGK